MLSVAQVLQRYGREYLERFGVKMPAEHRKVLHAIRNCRNDMLETAPSA